ncbi:LCP family protein required for cell wall assembly [Mumia flava]|uniref:LCP family protein required for cell wall assembly n=1 Tax=Mumia flava TaxID=1348852 RepID=A0A2M9BGR2_9ACTN|nr:LCP family protein [Mumia flava]PJJ57138.1 LCP family protein required for cell wall assembly [Mumia flava]
MSEYEGAGKRRAEKSRGWFRRHWVATLVASVLSVVVLATSAYAIGMMNSLGDIDRIDSTGTIKEETRPDPAPGEALNILVLGADAESDNNNNSSSIAESMAEPEWPVGSHRSDTIMIAHISADRKHVSVVSIPRDSYVPIYDETGTEMGYNKINAAFSDYGPAGAISTVENLTDVRLDHMVIMDWDGFKDMTEAVGGVRVYIPSTFYDSSQDITWEEGWQNLEGTKALKYVRTRYGLTDGDFGRIERQQNFIRLVLKKMISPENTRNPITLQRTVNSVAENMTIDEDFTNSDLMGLAFALRGIQVDDVNFLTAPLAEPSISETAEGMSIVNLDEEKGEELYTLLKRDRIQKYLKQNPDAELGDTKEID